MVPHFRQEQNQIMRLIIFVEAISDFDEYDFDTVFTGIWDRFYYNSNEFEVVDSVKIKEGNFNKAKYEIALNVRDVNVHYLGTAFETETSFIQMICFSDEPSFEDYKPVFEKILNSFKQIKIASVK